MNIACPHFASIIALFFLLFHHVQIINTVARSLNRRTPPNNNNKYPIRKVKIKATKHPPHPHHKYHHPNQAVSIDHPIFVQTMLDYV